MQTKYIEATGKTIDDAISSAITQLGVDRDSVSVEVLEKPKSGFLGIGGNLAKIKVSYSISNTDKAQKFLEDLFIHMGASTKADIFENEEGNLEIQLSGADVSMLIGRRGETLDAIQHLTSYAINIGEENRARVSIDAEGYRAKREEALCQLARKTAGKAVKLRKNVTLEPMNAYERHVIHLALQDWRDVSTFSTGVQQNRRIVVAYNPGKKKTFPSDSRGADKARHNQPPVKN